MVDSWSDDYYKTNIRSIASMWNFNVPLNAGPYALTTADIGLPMRFTERSLLWRDYYFGKQKNTDYDHQLINEDGTRKALKMFRGKEIFKLVNFMLADMIDTINALPNIVQAKGSSENIVSARKTQLDLQKFAVDSRNAQFLQSMAQEFGVYFETQSGKTALTNQAQQLQSEDFIEGLETGAKNIAKDAYYRNHLSEILKEVAKDALISGFGGTKTSIVNGYPLVENIPSTEAIFPPMTNGDQHRYDAYGGRIRFLTVQEIFALFPELSAEDKAEIQNMSYNTSCAGPWFNNYNYAIGNSNFYWWQPYDGVMRIAVVECQWASYDKKEADEYRQCLREGVLIGNKYLLRHGISKNQTKDWRNPSETGLDYQFVQPMNVFGYNMGIPEILYTYQNLADAMQTKANELIARSKGKVYSFNANMMGGMGKHGSDIISELAQNGITIVPGGDGEGPNNGRIVEAIDMTMDPTLIPLMQQVREYRAMMSDILNIPDAVRGQLNGYQTTQNVESQIAQSGKGTSYFYDPFNTYLKRVMQKVVDKFKVATLDNPNIEYSLIVGDSEIELFKATKEFGLSKFNVHVDFEDVVDAQYRQSMEGMVMAYAQNTAKTGDEFGYTMSDLFKVQSLDTKREIENYVNFRDFQIAQQKEQARVEALQAQQQQSELAAQTQLQQTQMNNDAADAREAAKIESQEAMKVAEMAQERAMASVQTTA